MYICKGADSKAMPMAQGGGGSIVTVESEFDEFDDVMRLITANSRFCDRTVCFYTSIAFILV